MRAILVLVAFGLAWWGFRRGREPVPGGTRRTLVLFAATALALRLINPLVGWPDAPARLVHVVAGLAVLLNWGAISWLIGRGTRRRDAFVRVPLLAVAAITALAGAPWGVPAGFTMAACWSFRWKRELDTRALFRLALLGMALLALLSIRLPWAPGPRDGLTIDAVRWASAVSLFYVIVGVFELLAAFVRDPSLGIRTVSRRLALSHVLVVVIPLGLTAGLWATTTVLGVNAERAQTGARQVTAEAAQLETALDAALAAPGPAPPRMRALADVAATRWPRMSVWLASGDSLERVHGDAVPQEGRLTSWAFAADSVPRHGVIQLGDSSFLAARAFHPATRTRAVALAPIVPVLAGTPSRVAGARLRLHGVTRVSSSGFTFDANEVAVPDDSLMAERSAADSATLERVRRATRRAGVPDSVVRVVRRPGARITAGSDTIQVLGEGRDPQFFLRGWALVEGMRFRSGAWDSTTYLLSSYQSPSRVLGGLFNSGRANPMQILPLLMLVPPTILVLLVGLFDLVMVTNMGRSITDAIGALRVAARKLEAGDLSHRIEVRGQDDLWSVASAFNRAAEGLEHARAVEKENDRLESELELARRIHARLLPAGPPEVPGLEIAGSSESAREVGGDYFDHIDLGRGRVLLVVADVSGKGVPAALLMSGFRASLVSQDLSRAEPARVSERLNEFLHQSVDPGRFVTAFIGFLDAATGRLVYVNAGHNPPVLLRADGAAESLTRGGTILGILQASRFESGETTLAAGDLLALYTDGVTEGANAAGELWGDDRLLAALRREAERPCREIVATLVAEVRAFEGDQGPADDITILLARRTG